MLGTINLEVLDRVVLADREVPAHREEVTWVVLAVDPKAEPVVAPKVEPVVRVDLENLVDQADLVADHVFRRYLVHATRIRSVVVVREWHVMSFLSPARLFVYLRDRRQFPRHAWHWASVLLAQRAGATGARSIARNTANVGGLVQCVCRFSTKPARVGWSTFRE